MSEEINLDHQQLANAGGEHNPIGSTDAQAGLERPLNAPPHATAPSAEDGGALRSLGGATAWLNSQPLTTTDLRGKVVLIDFWTYTCINWLRTLPCIRAWAERYRDQGLVVIGVHTPEFPFEHDVENVRRAAQDEKVEYPIAVDSDYAIRSGFDNHYWPALYLLDAEGQIRHHHFGEGEYTKSEVMIQRLLAEIPNSGIGSAGADLVSVSVEARGVEAAAKWDDLKSPETYLGAERAEQFASPGGLAAGVHHAYSVPAKMRLNHWALSGDWIVQEQAAVLNAANGRIAYRLHARDVNLVMGPGPEAAARGASVRFRVLLDGQAPGSAHGSDIDDQGNGTATYPRLYQLIRQPQPIVDRLVEIEFRDAGAKAFAFTFG